MERTNKYNILYKDHVDDGWKRLNHYNNLLEAKRNCIIHFLYYRVQHDIQHINPAVHNIPTLIEAKKIAIKKYLKTEKIDGDVRRRRVLFGQRNKVFQIVHTNTKAWR